MTTQQIILWSCAYLIELGAVVYFTRATARRVVAALVVGAVAALLGLGAIALCEALGWWRVPFASTPYFLPLFYLGLLISLLPEVNQSRQSTKGGHHSLHAQAAHYS